MDNKCCDIEVVIEAPVTLATTITQPAPGLPGKDGIDGKDGVVQTVNLIEADDTCNVQTYIELPRSVYDLIGTPDPRVVYYIDESR
jgi:hypothetical protein